MRVSLVSMSLMVALLIAASSLVVNSQSQKPEVIYGPNSLERVEESDRKSLDRSLTNFLHAINTNSFKDCFSVDLDYLQAQVNPFPYLMDVQQSGRHNDPWFFKPVVSYVVRSEKDSYNLKIAFIGNDPDSNIPVLRLIHSLVAKKRGDNFVFYSPLENIKVQWNKRKIGSVTFYYDEVFNEEVAIGFAEFNAQLAEKLDTEVIDVTYFKCRDGRELFYIIGCDYINNAYFAKTGGLAEPWRNYIFAGNNSEAYPHELVHLYTAGKFGSPRNYIADEGYCTYLGGTGELGLDELIVRLRKYLDNEPETDIMQLFLSDFQIDGEYSALYIVSGLIMRSIEGERGIEGVERMIKAENGLDGYFEVLNELLGINEQNFSEKIRSILSNQQ